MNDDLQLHELQQKRTRAVRTAWVLGFIAVTIFVTFIASAIFGR